MMHGERSTRRLSPRVRVALSKIPSSSYHSAPDVFSISSKSRMESFCFAGVPLVQLFLGQERTRVAVPEIARMRADQGFAVS